METLISKLGETSSLNEKVALMMQYDTPKVREAFFLTLNPNVLTNIKQFNPSGTGPITFEQGFDEFKMILMDLHNRIITGNEARNHVNMFLSKCQPETQEIFKLMLLKDLRVGVGPALVEKAYAIKIPKFQVQLAEKYKDYVKKMPYQVPFWWASYKLDGIRGFYDGKMLKSRNGNPIFGFEHIYPELNKIMEETDAPFLDGELFSKNIPFQKISSIVSKKTNMDPKLKKQVKYHLFYIGGNHKNTTEMVQKIAKCANLHLEFVEFVPYQQVENTESAINALCEKYTEMGYEGVMLRHPELHYVWKRDWALLKHKLFIESDFKIVGTYEGKPGSELEGNLGGIIIEGEYEGKKIHSECGSGFKLGQSEENLDNRPWFWKYRNTPEVLGQTVEIKFQGVTDKPNEQGFYSLRFPIYRKLKQDR